MDKLQVIFTLLFARNVDSVLAAFKVQRSKLMRLADKMEKEAEQHLEQSKAHITSAQSLAVESGRAKRAADNLAKLCGDAE